MNLKLSFLDLKKQWLILILLFGFFQFSYSNDLTSKKLRQQKDVHGTITDSNNVSHWTPKDQQQYTHRANYVFNGQKADIYEGGHHIPYIAKWPTKIKPGSSSNQIMCTTDLLATLSGITGKSLTKGAREDSYNMLLLI
ncbi:hypothetical protein BST83_00655 [Polaribacter filamentus]|uniref:Uncharacterized protein n=1 Tax=Polaribacter filamentus TaxID=53483 RepID=A0A2S7L210_9FLAO|nr:hypothetical protein [Polaribacter filamentus]PQB08907.1 hypothetical protein BST83_00655 [Polaribacter filamentus]